jgi:TPR repeat protein
VPVLTLSCQAGDGKTCGTASGRIDEKVHPADFFDLARRGCALDDATSCGNLGFAYAKGIGVAKDEAKGLELYRKACDAKALFACANAGLALEHATPPDYDGAAQMFARGCPPSAKNHDTSECTKAAGFYKRRCDAGDQAACASTK